MNGFPISKEEKKIQLFAFLCFKNQYPIKTPDVLLSFCPFPSTN